MKLPNATRALVDIRKLRDYCLSPTHPKGRHKARVFAAALGLTADQAGELQSELLEAARTQDATPITRDKYGRHRGVDFRLATPTGWALIRSGWIVRDREDFPRLTSCYVLPDGRDDKDRGEAS